MNQTLLLRIGFWSLCCLACIWIGLSLMFEIHMGLPTTGLQWGKRLLGWGLEIWLVRTLMLGVRRYYGACPRRA